MPTLNWLVDISAIAVIYGIISTKIDTQSSLWVRNLAFTLFDKFECYECLFQDVHAHSCKSIYLSNYEGPLLSKCLLLEDFPDPLFKRPLHCMRLSVMIWVTEPCSLHCPRKRTLAREIILFSLSNSFTVRTDFEKQKTFALNGPSLWSPELLCCVAGSPISFVKVTPTPFQASWK